MERRGLRRAGERRSCWPHLQGERRARRKPVDVDLGLRLSPGSRAEPWVHGNARSRHGCVRQELAAGVIGPRQRADRSRLCVYSAVTSRRRIFTLTKWHSLLSSLRHIIETRGHFCANSRPSRRLGWANFVGPLSGMVWTRTPSDPCASTKYLARLKVFFDAGMTPR